MSVPVQTRPVAATPVTHRIVPALVGHAARAQAIYIPCPEWCVVDHLDPMTCFDDIVHYSDADSVTVLTLTDDVTAHSELSLNISSDPTARDPRLRSAHLVVNDAASVDAYLTPDMAEELADDLITFAVKMRTAARTARQANQSQAG
ncbi:hypothetical protein ABT010_13315 [Streptomyces sp. NPDC002668]|uniref:DUF6907 domain-containing protein n=1 Tax=Streptomyces sp. NPDC002668 TaxID=3154422 RepID=UPI0033195361